MADARYPYAEHDDGVVLTQPESGKFQRRPMTPAELAAREPALKIAKDIYRHANQAGVCYYEFWRLIADAIAGAAPVSHVDAQQIVEERLDHWRRVCERDFAANAPCDHNIGRRAECAVILEQLKAAPQPCTPQNPDEAQRAEGSPTREPNGTTPEGRHLAADSFAAAAAPVSSERAIDLDALDWKAIKESAGKSKWMPPDYMQNDWVFDVRQFLEEGPAVRSSTDAPAEAVIKALRELADGYVVIEGVRHELGILGRTSRESLIANALARVSATRPIDQELKDVTDGLIGRGQP